MTARLWKDGHGIERLPLKIVLFQVDSEGRGPVEADVLVVKRDDLLALEALLDQAMNVIAILCPSGIHWDDPEERAEIFAEATGVWESGRGVVRGDDAMTEDDDEERPQ